MDGVLTSNVATPASTEETAAVLRDAAERGWAVVARGGGTKLDWGLPPERTDLVVDTSRLDRIVEHAAGDLVVRVQAGVPLRGLQAQLAEARQMLAIDTVLDDATVGGTVATALSGPMRMRYGSVRDLLIGITVVRADGTVATSGGKVVKNVAGYDLGKLYTGSYGTLGIVTEAVFRLHPLPAVRTWICTSVSDPGTAAALCDRVRSSQLDVSALEIDRLAPGGPVTIAVLVEGVREGAAARASSVAAILGDGAHIDRQPPPWWARLPWSPGWLGMRMSFPLSVLRQVLGCADRAAAHADVTAHLRGSVGVGVLYVGLRPEEPGALAAYVSSLRADLEAHGSHVVVLCAPEDVRKRVDVWGPVPGIDLMRRVKQQFDPERRLAPGRFVGGI